MINSCPAFTAIYKSSENGDEVENFSDNRHGVHQCYLSSTRCGFRVLSEKKYSSTQERVNLPRDAHSIQCDRNRTARGVSFTNIGSDEIRGENHARLTGDHLPRVVNDTLVVLVGPMREIHTDYLFIRSKRSMIFSKRQAPILTPAFRSSASFSTVFTFGPVDAKHQALYKQK
jgi:hypothetical protein